MRQAAVGYAFLGAPLLGCVLFTVVPVLGAFYIGLLRWDLLTEPRFVGLANVGQMLCDAKFWNALKNTSVFCLGSVPLAIDGGLLLALLLNQRVRGIRFFSWHVLRSVCDFMGGRGTRLELVIRSRLWLDQPGVALLRDYRTGLAE